MSLDEDHDDNLVRIVSHDQDDKPQFMRNTVITERALVVDEDGTSWWVDPTSFKIFRA